MSEKLPAKSLSLSSFFHHDSQSSLSHANHPHAVVDSTWTQTPLRNHEILVVVRPKIPAQR